MMQILSQQTLRGLNYWSHEHPKLILTRLEVSGSFELGAEQKRQLFGYMGNPGISSVDQEKPQNALFDNVASLALQLQRMVGSDLSHYAYRATAYPAIYNLVVEYQYEEVGLLAVNLAVQCLNRLWQGEEPNFEAVVRQLQLAYQNSLPAASLVTSLEQANKMAIPVFKGQYAGDFHFGYGCRSVVVNENTDQNWLLAEMQQGRFGRIPLLAITGSNGKTTTTRLLAHIIRQSGKSVGFTTSDGIYINEQMIDEGDTTGPISAQLVLADQRVEVAVLETARGGILRAGLGFDQCDLAVVTNIQADHLGIADIETLDQLASVKEVIVQAVKPGGWAVLNAGNAYTLAMGQRATCATAWFSRELSPQLDNALDEGRPVAFVEQEQLVIQLGTHKYPIAPLHQVPISFNGSLGFMVENALAASLAAFVHGVPTQIIGQALASFYPSVEQTPGRMNLFELNGHTLLVDFAHNPDGFAGIRDFLATVQAPLKIGIIVGTGDRLDDDTRELGRLSAQMFDLTLIHQVKFLRGRTAEELTALLVEGIQNHKPQAPWQRIPDETEPLAYALKLAPPGSFIVALSDVLTDVQLLVEQCRQTAEGA